MQSIFFHVKMDYESGLLEFDIEESPGLYPVRYVMEILQEMLREVQFVASREDLEVVLALYGDHELVIFEAKEGVNSYELTSAERIATAISEIEFQLARVAEMESKLEKGRLNENWKEDGF
jgi:hypothetical protein